MERSNFVTINADRLYEMDKLTGTEYAIFNFIIRTTNLFRKLYRTNDPHIKEKLKPPTIPKSIMNLSQME